MSDYLPFEIQAEIMKWLPVKSLIQFRSLSKTWKSLIDCSRFMADYSGPVQHLLVRYDLHYRYDKPEYVLIADDDTFPGRKVYPTVPHSVKMLQDSRIIGSSHGLLCLYGYYEEFFRVPTALLWNISIRKAFHVAVPNVAYQKYKTILGFGICPETCDPKVIKIIHIDSWKDVESIPDTIPWQVEVFTLSARVWRSPCTTNLPRKSIRFSSEQVVVGGFLYWIVTDGITTDGGFRLNLTILFDITREEFREINLPDALAHHKPYELSMSKLRESLVVLQRNDDRDVYTVWMMEDGVPKLFTKISSICTPDATVLLVLEFRKSGEPIIEIFDDSCDRHEYYASLFVYEPYSKHISNLGIREWLCSFSVHSYMETLLLLDQPDATTNDFESEEQELSF